MKLFREKAGVISADPCWVIIDGSYLYCGSLLRVLFEFVFEHNHDKHLVG